MNSIQRRNEIIEILNISDGAVSASLLADKLQVSRQVIVSDIALLRAKDHDILSTPRGYIINPARLKNATSFKIACSHGSDLVKHEIYTIIDNGGELMDVIVEHPIYGQLAGQLNISSRRDADDFLAKLENEKINLLCQLTYGIHLHTISCANKDIADRICKALLSSGILLT